MGWGINQKGFMELRRKITIITRYRKRFKKKPISLLMPKYRGVVAYHADDFRIDCFGEDSPACGDVVYDFVESCPLDLFAFEVSHWVHEVEADTALA